MELAAWLLLQSPSDVELFQRHAGDPDPAVRTRAIDALIKHRTLSSGRLIAPMLADDHPRVRYHAELALATIPGDEVVDLLCGRIRDLARGRIEAIQTLGRLRNPRALDTLIGALDEDSTRAEAARALGSIGHKRGLQAVEAAKPQSAEDKIAQLEVLQSDELARARISDPSPEVRLAAVARHPDPPIKDPDWRVRSAAIDRLVKLQSVPPLLEMLDRETGRLREECRRALQALSGKNFGDDAKAWKNWWRLEGEDWKPSAAKPQAGKAETRFFDVPIFSRRIAFVIDFSGSMRDDSKIDVVRKELARTIDLLPKEAEFTIVPMSCDEQGRARKPWDAALQPATEMHKALAIKFLNREEARGYTNLYDALLAALQSGADTVCLYSDGGASRGVFVSVDDVLAKAAEANRMFRVRINAIQLKSAQSKEWQTRLMRGLAELSGGEYILKAE